MEEALRDLWPMIAVSVGVLLCVTCIPYVLGWS